MSSVNAGTGLRERKKQQTREALHRAAMRLYAERGSDSVTVNDICAAADVSPRTFFNYFESKDGAVLDWYEEQAGGSLADRIAARPAEEEPLPAIYEAIKSGVRRLQESATWREYQQLMRQNPRLLPDSIADSRRSQALMCEGVARRTGHPVDDLYPRALAAAAHAITRVALAQWDPADPESDLPGILDTSFGMLASGFPLPPG
ncbi:putative transcriptional regulator, TetR family [Nocardia nova SH22a]|uniref:Putative transcriptional regulator, TetR family n=1 Tax=Nocardia nova SH22a TaxID=1415166 RepID=W5TBB8_9NOCA|nr:TetR family transcriptional regulator [Nocardia nova]AHH16665.1 putative transcriptional regulator, TetR family [Nocardia nova SH22a]